MIKSTLALTITLSVAGLTASGAAQDPAPVSTDSGWVQGVSKDGVTVYRGIPFAAPPVGDLRWRPPLPAAPWDGVREATTFAADPYQGDGKGNVSEDCLYLNIWTPAKSADERVPVLSRIESDPLPTAPVRSNSCTTAHSDGSGSSTDSTPSARTPRANSGKGNLAKHQRETEWRTGFMDALKQQEGHL